VAYTAQWMIGDLLLMAAQSESELEALVRDHAQLVFRIVYSVLRNHADAEDATQETFLRAVRHRAKLREIHDAKAWLARIAWRVAIDRKRMGTTASLDDIQGTEGAAALRSLRDSGAGAEQIAADRQMLALMEQLIAGLPRELREVTILATVEELTTREMSEVLGIPEATVRTRLFRARQMLRDKLATLLERADWAAPGPGGRSDA
jgi:RNA polymerase sigma-70 factor, ECF subfamily